MGMRILGCCALALLCDSATGAPAPMRPLPQPTNRALGSGGARYVDPSGADTNDGSKQAPWKSIAHAIRSARSGETIYLRGGVYHEAVTINRGGTKGAPLTLRSAPNELAVIDAGFAEFVDTPGSAWEPVAGSRNEFRSKNSFPSLQGAKLVGVTGNFADTMIPLHGYRFAEDLRATNVFWNVETQEPGAGIYLGPGVWFDPSTQRIHARLTPIGLRSMPDYDGPTDPRKVRLVINGERSALRIENAQHVRIQDIVLRGSHAHTVHLERASDIELDRLTIYGGAPAVWARSTNRLSLLRSAVRGTAAPWSSRPSMKYRGNSPYLMIVDHALPQSTDWEIAFCELTDSHDGVVIDSIKKLRFHHNLVEGFNDDALYLTYVPREAVGDDIQIYENQFSRAFTALAFGDTGVNTKNAIGSGIYVFRNLFDLRERTHRHIPENAGEDATPKTKSTESRLAGDHGNPIWDPVFFYHNTVLTDGQPWRNYYGAVFVQSVKGSKRRLFNNIFVRMDGDPGLAFQRPTDDLQVDGNLLWGVATGASSGADFFEKFRKSRAFVTSQGVYPPGFTAHDIFADPLFRSLGPKSDIRLQPRSPAIDAGLPIPAAWPDSLRNRDAGKPDIGAIPSGALGVRVGLSAGP